MMGMSSKRYVDAHAGPEVVAAAFAIPKEATLNDGRVVAVKDWSVDAPCDGLLLVTFTGYVRRESVAQSHQDQPGRERTG